MPGSDPRRAGNLRPRPPRLRNHPSFTGSRPRRGTAARTLRPSRRPRSPPGTPAYLRRRTTSPTCAERRDRRDDRDHRRVRRPERESDLAATVPSSPPGVHVGIGCFAKCDQNAAPATWRRRCRWELEISLDLDAVSALCPNCRIDLVEANAAGTSDLAAAQLMRARCQGSARFGRLGRRPHLSPGAQLPHGGGLDLPGDYDRRGLGASAIRVPPRTTSRRRPGRHRGGGTTLQPDSTSGVQNVRGFAESAWSGAGSGYDLWQAKPSYQTDTGCTGRSYADISADADPNTGMQVYDTDDGGWVVVGGTSEASPLIAAYYAVVGSAGQGPAWAYANDTLLNDPSSGSNGTCAATISYICNAAPATTVRPESGASRARSRRARRASRALAPTGPTRRP